MADWTSQVVMIPKSNQPKYHSSSFHKPEISVCTVSVRFLIHAHSYELYWWLDQHVNSKVCHDDFTNIAAYELLARVNRCKIYIPMSSIQKSTGWNRHNCFKFRTYGLRRGTTDLATHNDRLEVSIGLCNDITGAAVGTSKSDRLHLQN